MVNIFSILFGTMVGSFLNVCIARLPKEESIVYPGSHCLRCGHAIRFYDNIPIISYLVLKGKCRDCQASISIQYPLVEGIAALGSFLLFLRFGPSVAYLIYFAFLSALIVITVIDLYIQEIPTVISVPGIGAGLLASLVLPQTTFIQSLSGALIGAGSLYLVAKVYYLLTGREGMGLGDADLLAMIGAFLGWKAVILTVLLSSLIGSITGIIIMVSKGKDFKYAIPFGPFLSLGAVIALFYGPSLINWYLYLNR